MSLMFWACAESCICDRMPHMPKPVNSSYVLLVDLVSVIMQYASVNMFYQKR